MRFRLALGGGVLVAVLLGFGPVHADEPARPAKPPGQPSWQRQQPTRERTNRLLKQHGVGQSEAERTRELRSLNDIHRQLMPSGSAVPAPEVAR